jgi:hypothetical protein
MNDQHTLTLDESQRQFVLLALAHLAIERPGWDDMISVVVAEMDTALPNGRFQMYEEFKRTHDPRRVNEPSDPNLPRGEDTAQYLIPPNGRFILCKKCCHTSFNLNDVRERCCAWCNTFHEKPTTAPTP